MFVIAPSVALVVGLGIFCSVVLGNYFVALGWHLRHGNHTIIRGYRVSVPLLWWREDYYGGNIGLERAVPRNLLETGNGAIEWYPVADNKLVATEDQALRAAQRDVAHPIFADKPGDVISVVPLRREQKPRCTACAKRSRTFHLSIAIWQERRLSSVTVEILNSRKMLNRFCHP